MLRKRLTQLAVITCLLLPSGALSQIQDIKNYEVEKGDTLWDISGKELNDPFLWPKIWKENPELTNPDRVYPGQIIRIPLYIMRKEEPQPSPVPEMKTESAKADETVPETPEQPIPLTPLVNKHLLMASGYISDSVPSAGVVAGSPSGRRLLGNDDLVYVKTDNAANKGDKFYVIRADNLAKHPLNGDVLGHIIEIRGVAEIVRQENGRSEAKILHMFDDIMVGDLLEVFHEMTPPLTTNVFRKPAIEGFVVAARNMRFMNSNYDIVYINRGAKDGIEIGDLFKTTSSAEGQNVSTGTIQIIDYRDTTATAIVRKTDRPVSPGNPFTQLE